MSITLDCKSDNPPTVATVAEWLQLFADPSGVMELRALEHTTGNFSCTMSGFFDCDHLDDMAENAMMLTQQSKGVFFTFNPLNPDLLARCANRVKKSKSEDCASDKDVLRRRWLLVDADPVRVAGVSATDAEKDCAFDKILEARNHLEERGWPSPILADSGNGFHLFYRIDLPTDDKGLVQKTLLALAQRFDTEQVKIDCKVFNPARIVKLYGTWARKGDSLPNRPHRQAKILEVPA